MSWLKDLLGKEIRTLIDGVESILPMRKTLRIIGSSAISAEDNPTAGTTDLYIAPSGSLSDVLSAGNDAGGKTIENLDDPLNSTDAATKGYVDNAVAEIDGSKLVDGTVTGDKLVDGSVTGDKIASGTAALGLVLRSTAATTIPSTAQNT